MAGEAGVMRRYRQPYRYGLSKGSVRRAVRDSRLGLEVIRSRPVLLIPLPLATIKRTRPTAIRADAYTDEDGGDPVDFKKRTEMQR